MNQVLLNSCALSDTFIALPSKPIQTVELFDADQRTALAFVKQKLEDAGSNVNFNGQETVAIERLGGRASDLDSVRY